MIRRQFVLAACTVLLLAAGLATWLAWPSAARIPGADRVRQYRDVRACLLTGPGGVASGQAAAAWAGMEAASLATRTMVSYQPVAGPAAGAAALPYVASLVQRQCAVIVAAGSGVTAAVAADAGKFRRVRFVVVAGHGSAPNLTVVPVAAAARVQAAVSAAVQQRPVP
jgi:hypothetical protein